MALWKIGGDKPQKVKQTQFKQEKLLEEHLEDWIQAEPTMLGEPLLIIGRQVMIPDTKDRLDLLAVDPQGQAVIIELKRGKLKDPVDIQALRYASYISKWKFEHFESVARNFLGKAGDPDFNFNETFETFCQESGTDEVPDLNEDQRVIIVGSSVRDKLGSVALWLRDHNVDIKLIEVTAYKEGDSLLVEPNVIVPIPVSRFAKVGKGPTKGGSPWKTDGQTWHLEKRCSSRTRDMLLAFDKDIREALAVEGPHWNQKLYVAYRKNNYNWLCVHTLPKTLIFDFNVKAGTFESDALAKTLDVAKFEKDESMSGKLNLPSSVAVTNRTEVRDRVRLRVKDDFDLKSESFVKFMTQAFEACPK